MRATQTIGLTDQAREFLAQHARRVNYCASCGRDDGYVRTVIGRTGMFDDLPLHEYELQVMGAAKRSQGDAVVAREVVQTILWSSGPMIWLALQVGRWERDEASGGPWRRHFRVEQEFTWPEKEIHE